MSAGKRFVKHDELQTILRRIEYRLRQLVIAPPVVETAINTVTPIDTSAFELLANKAQASGYCDLDAEILVPLARLAAIVKSPDVHYFRKSGAANWYPAPIYNGGGCQTQTIVANRLYAYPFLCPKEITVDRLGTNVETAVAGSNVRFGIYSDNGSQEPGALLIDGGQVSTATTGDKTVSISQVLSAMSLYWMVITNSHTPTLWSFIIANIIPILGRDTIRPANPIVGYYADSAYGALPDPFPAPTVLTAVPLPGLFVRLSA